MHRDSVMILLETVEALRRRVIDLERENEELIRATRMTRDSVMVIDECGCGG